MKIHSPARPAAIVITWSHNAAPAAVREVVRRIVGLGIPTTWALQQASQVESLAGWGLSRQRLDVALAAEVLESNGARTADDGVVRELARQLGLLRDHGSEVSTIQATPALATGVWPRLLRGLGVHGLMVASHGPAAPHALPFGVWHFAPHAALPRQRRWLSWLRRRPALIASHVRGPAVIAVDLARMAAPGSRGWREAEQALDEAAAAHHEETIALATLSTLTARLSEASAPRPQRSILRAA
jgi:hypothetical protein